MYFLIQIRWFIAILVALLALSSCFVRNMSDGFEQKRERELDDLINKSENLTALAEVCGQLGSIQEFELLRRRLSRDGSYLTFYFKSDKPFLEAAKHFSTYLIQNGWSRLDESRASEIEYYRKENLEVEIQYGGIGDAEYGIACGKSSTTR